MTCICVFDSGVGGLTVLKALKSRWPGENFVYLADTARLPYGSKSLHTIRHYVEQNIRYLSNYRPKAIVIACNSASAAVLEQSIVANVPVFNVIEPGARKAIEHSQNDRIGVLGTRATVYSETYVRALRKLRPDAEVFQQACPLWVPLVEEGWLEDPITNLIVYRYVTSIMAHQVDTIIMGCTHYPALRASLERAVGKHIALIDSSTGLIEDLAQLELTEVGHGQTQILCTDFSPRLEETICLLLGDHPIDVLETVDLI